MLFRNEDVSFSVNRRHLIQSISALAAGICMPGKAQDMTIPVATTSAPGSFIMRNLQAFADQSNRQTKENMQFMISTGGEKVAEADLLHAVSRGKVAIAEMPMAAFSGHFPILGLDTLPFIVRNVQDAMLMWEVSKPEVVRQLAKEGVRLLYVDERPFPYLFSHRVIASVQDLRGLKLWVNSDTARSVANNFGMSAIEFPSHQLGTAIEEGRIDAAFISSAGAITAQAWKGFRYGVEVHAWLPKNMICVSETVWKTWNNAVQTAVLEAAAAAEDNGWKLLAPEEETGRKALLERKVVLSAPTLEFRRALDGVGERVGSEWVKRSGAAGSAVLLEYYRKRG